MSVEGEKKFKRGALAQHRLAIVLAALFVSLYSWQLLEHWGPSAREAGSRPLSVLQRVSSGSGPGALLASFTAPSTGSAGAAAAAGAAPALSLPASTLKYFPQAARCSTGWMAQHAQLQADIQAGKLPPRYLVSVAVEAGLADRLAGLITHLWHAVLTGRALTTVTYGSVPSFKAMCDSPFINWLDPPPQLPAEVVEPLKTTYKGMRDYPAEQRSLPSQFSPESYQMLYHTNTLKNVAVYQYNNISELMQPDPTYLLASSNRGRSYALANNKFHKQQFWQYGVPPTDAFMCGVFFLCSPVEGIQRYYQKFWDELQQPGVLRIGIQIRTGDGVFFFNQEDKAVSAKEAVKSASEFFECAEKLEKTYAAPGQRVVWYLNSDSLQLRKAAKEVYGAKLVTDDELKAKHPDCYQDGAKVISRTSNISSGGAGDPVIACGQDEALMHSLGAMLTFSMTDLQIVSGMSGFGRLGSWLSGQWNNMYQVEKGQGSCTPGRPVPPEKAVFHYQGV